MGDVRVGVVNKSRLKDLGGCNKEAVGNRHKSARKSLAKEPCLLGVVNPLYTLNIYTGQYKWYSSFISIHYIIEIRWKKYFPLIGMLITVDAVSRYVATVEIPSGGRWVDASMRKYNEYRESCVRLGASLNVTVPGA